MGDMDESPLLRTGRAFAPRAATAGAQVQAVGLNVKARCGPRRSTRSNEPRPAARDERVDRVEAPDGGADLVGEGAPTGDEIDALRVRCRRRRWYDAAVAGEAEGGREEDLRDRLVAAEAALEVVLLAAGDAAREKGSLVERRGRIESLEGVADHAIRVDEGA